MTILLFGVCIANAQTITIKMPDKKGAMLVSRRDTVVIVKRDTVYLKQPRDINTYLNFVGGSDAALRFNDSLHAEVGESKTRIWQRYEPLEKGQGSLPWLMGQSTTNYGTGQNDEVMISGWNITPGGAAYKLGEPGIGYSLEQHYKPAGPGMGLTESHEYYIRPDGKQIRLKSYTIFNETGNVDFYHTVAPFYLRHPLNPNNVYIRASSDSSGKNTEMSLNGENPVLRIGGIIIQGLEWTGGKALRINSGLNLPTLKAPPGTVKHLGVNDNGDIIILP